MSTISDEHVEHTTASGAPPGAALEQADNLARVRALLARLPHKQQEVLRLKFQHGLSYAEIGRVMQESVGNVGWLIHVGLKQLRAELAAEELKGVRA
jgi:RNA polymerase sigma-70 factor (ECF subfamily)